jgi:hypothetical protein
MGTSRVTPSATPAHDRAPGLPDGASLGLVSMNASRTPFTRHVRFGRDDEAEGPCDRYWDPLDQYTQ